VSDVLALVHIPKTAGTTLAGLMRFHYGKAFRGAANALKDPAAAEDRLAMIARKPQIRASAGHVTVGMVDAALPGATLATILRDPVERTLSHYGFLVDPPAGRKKPAGSGLLRPGTQPPASLEEALGDQIPDDLQTRMLCGIVSPYDELPPDALDHAKANLDRFAFVGTTERFDELLTLMNRELGWPVTAYRRARPNPRSEPADADRALAAAHNRLDAELYAYASALLPPQDTTALTSETALANARAADEALERRKQRKREKSR
jgi:hypothetical protein